MTNEDKINDVKLLLKEVIVKINVLPEEIKNRLDVKFIEKFLIQGALSIIEKE